MRKEVSYKTIYLTFGILVISFAIASLAIAQWTEPTSSPPGDNVATPLNVSNVGQSKVGGLILNTGGAANGLIVDQGNVGIGTTSPTAKLDIGGIPGTDGIKFPDGTLQTTAASQSGFGSWVSKSNNTTYQATTDGFVSAYSGSATTTDVSGLTDSSNPPSTIRARDAFLNTYAGQPGRSSITMPVKKDDYWRVTGAVTVYWISIGN